MINLKIKSHHIDYLIIFLLVVMTAGVSFLGATIFRLFLLIIVMRVLILRKHKMALNKRFFYFLVFLFLWFISVLFFFEINLLEDGQLLTYLSFFTMIFAAYYSIVVVNNFFETYVKVIYHLAIISFVFFTLQILHFEMLLNMLRIFDELNSFLKGGIPGRPSIVIFSYPADAGFIIRNSGFATEPGEFSVFLIFALMLWITFNNFKFDKIVTILIVATLTTFSTAGYLGLIVFILYYLYNKRLLDKKIITAIILVPAVLFILGQKFVQDKIEGALDREIARYEDAFQQRITPGRFGSFMLDLEDFKKNPFIGYGIHLETRYIHYGTIEQQRTNGVSDFLLKFGIFGFLIMLYNFRQTFNRIGKQIKASGVTFFIFSGIMIVAFAQVILSTPLFFAIQFYHFKPKDR